MQRIRSDLKDFIQIDAGEFLYGDEKRRERIAEPFAIASGNSLRFPDDQENLSHQFEVYDALYAWCRLQAAKIGVQ